MLQAVFQHLDSLNFHEISYLGDSIPVKGYTVEPKKREIPGNHIQQRGKPEFCSFEPGNAGK